MRIGRKLVEAYFDLVYTPVYDFTTSQLSSYRRLQNNCIDRLQIAAGDTILCVGVGTGNEILGILERDGQVEITGIDISPRALKRACRKAAKRGKKIKLLRMDASKLTFADESFDKVLCFHVMDFVENGPAVTGEIMRVLKKNGRFTVSYPSASEGLGMGITLLKEHLRLNSSSRKNLPKIFFKFFITGIVYLPLLARGDHRNYASAELENLFASLNLQEFHLKEDTLYQDFAVYGRK
jgi:ubiquinone/menaquinone biosynthesis C-methylase UbiE